MTQKSASRTGNTSNYGFVHAHREGNRVVLVGNPIWRNCAKPNTILTDGHDLTITQDLGRTMLNGGVDGPGRRI